MSDVEKLSPEEMQQVQQAVQQANQNKTLLDNAVLAFENIKLQIMLTHGCQIGDTVNFQTGAITRKKAEDSKPEEPKLKALPGGKQAHRKGKKK